MGQVHNLEPGLQTNLFSYVSALHVIFVRMKQRCPSREFLDVSEALQSLTQEELLLAIKEATKRYQEMRADTWASFPEELWSLILQQCNRRMVSSSTTLVLSSFVVEGSLDL